MSMLRVLGVPLLLLAALTAAGLPRGGPDVPRCARERGGIVRLDSTRKVVYLVFTGHEFAEGGEHIRRTLARAGAKASFFFTGDFYRNPPFAALIRGLRRDGHYLGAHSDRHLLYASWDRRESTLVSAREFRDDLRANYGAMRRFGITRREAPWFLPPYEWYNDTISAWTARAGLRLVNFTPGTSSNADYTVPSMGARYLPSDTILTRILRYESAHRGGLNGFLLLTHVGTHPERTDKLWARLGDLLGELRRRGYRFLRLPA